jgi:hypothetical protein
MVRHGAEDHEIVWGGLRTPSLDYCHVRKENSSWRFTGMLIVKPKTNPFGLRYEILVDKKFKTRSLIVEKTECGLVSRQEIHSRRGAWFVDCRKRNDLHECTDIDLEASPVTNTIPIRRTRLKVGQKVNLTVAWVRIPALEVTPLTQSYERLSARKYLYRSASGFSAELEVDDFGLVTRYGDIWKEIG